jgi:hypothetical protein
MLTLSKGYKLPETGDFGNEWFPALEDNITRLNAHNHDGTNSEKLNSSAITAQTTTVLAAAFSSVGTDLYRASVTLPTGMLVATTSIVVRDPATKETIFLKTEQQSISQFFLFTNFVQDFEVVALT